MPPELHPGDPTAVAPPRPLLTIAIPTFHRAPQLRELLEVLRPQIAGLPQVEVLVADNASADETAAVIAAAAQEYAAEDARLRIHRHAENIGADANFAFCFREAEGHFFWMCGDDDRIVPGAVAEMLALLQGPGGEPAALDMVYATSYGYREDFQAERTGDPMGRQVHILCSARAFARVVNVMFTFISGMVVNKARLASVPHEAPETFIGTNLVQLSWTLPLLRAHRRSAVLWSRPVAARVGGAHGYSLGGVFGRQMAALVQRLLPGRPDLQRPIQHMTLRRWFPSVLVEARGQAADRLQLDEAEAELRHSFGRDPRFWLFTYPALRLPLWAARGYLKMTAVFNKLLYAVQLPGFWRKRC